MMAKTRPDKGLLFEADAALAPQRAMIALDAMARWLHDFLAANAAKLDGALNMDRKAPGPRAKRKVNERDE
jgi:hypothetical protein